MSVLVSMETGQTHTEIKFKIYAQDASKFEPQYCKLEGTPPVSIKIEMLDKEKSILVVKLQGCSSQLQMFKALVSAGQLIECIPLKCNDTFDSLNVELYNQNQKKLPKLNRISTPLAQKQELDLFVTEKILKQTSDRPSIISLFGTFHLQLMLSSLHSQNTDLTKNFIIKNFRHAGKATMPWMKELGKQKSQTRQPLSETQSKCTSARPEDKAGGDTAHISSQLLDKFGVSLTSPVDAIQPGDPVLKSEIEFFKEIREMNENIDAIKLIDKVEPLVKEYLRHADYKTESKNNQVSLVLKAAKDLLECAGYSQLKVNQVFAVMAGLNKDPDRKLLMEIGTGEGKSAISRLLAACYRELNGKKVDMISSSNILAERESEESAKFYERRNLTVKNNIYFGDKSLAENNNDNIYANGDVMIGTVNTFSVDELRDTANDCSYQPSEGIYQDMRGLGFTECRAKDILIADEVDNMFIDEKTSDTHLVSERHDIRSIDIIVIHIWRLIQEMFTDNPVDLKIEELTKKLVDTLEDSQCFKDLKLNRKDMDIWKLAQNAMALSAYTARFVFKEDVHYKVNQEKRFIQIIDKDNTGEIRNKERKWGNYLHMFIELKHHFTVSKTSDIEGIKTVVGFFDDYGPNIVGMTGTLGNKENKNFLKNSYNAVCLHVPKSNKNRQMVYDPVVGMPYTIDGQLCKVITQELVEYTADQLKQGRPCLIMAPSINEASILNEELKSVLLSLGLSKVNVISYINSEQDKGKIEDQLDSNTVVLSTALGGRGADFKLTKDAKKAGGLATILTYVTDSVRVEKQIQGRSARNGENGSFIMIVPRSQIDGFDSIEDNIENRNQAEKRKMMRDAKQVLDRRQKQIDVDTFVNKHREIKKSEPIKAKVFKSVFMEKINKRELAELLDNKEVMEELSDVKKMIQESLAEIDKSGELFDPSKPESEHVRKFDGKKMESCQGDALRLNLKAQYDQAGFNDKFRLGCLRAVVEINCQDNQAAKLIMTEVKDVGKKHAQIFSEAKGLENTSSMKRTIDDGIVHMKRSISHPKTKKLNLNLNDLSEKGLEKSMKDVHKFLKKEAVQEKPIQKLIHLIDNLENIKKESHKQATEEWVKSEAAENAVIEVKILQVIEHNLQSDIRAEDQLVFKNVDEALSLIKLRYKKVSSDEEEESTGYLGYIIGAVMVVGGACLVGFCSYPIMYEIGFELMTSGCDMIYQNYNMNERGTYNRNDVLKSGGMHLVASVGGPLLRKYAVPGVERYLKNKNFSDKTIEALKKGLLYSTKKSMLLNVQVKLLDSLGWGLKDNDLCDTITRMAESESLSAALEIAEEIKDRAERDQEIRDLAKSIKTKAASMSNADVIDMLGINIGTLIKFGCVRTENYEIILNNTGIMLKNITHEKRDTSTNSLPTVDAMYDLIKISVADNIDDELLLDEAAAIKSSAVYAKINNSMVKGLNECGKNLNDTSNAVIDKKKEDIGLLMKEIEEFEKIQRSEKKLVTTVKEDGSKQNCYSDTTSYEKSQKMQNEYNSKVEDFNREVKDIVKLNKEKTSVLQDFKDKHADTFIIEMLQAATARVLSSKAMSGEQNDARDRMAKSLGCMRESTESMIAECVMKGIKDYDVAKQCQMMMDDLKILVCKNLEAIMTKILKRSARR